METTVSIRQTDSLESKTIRYNWPRTIQCKRHVDLPEIRHKPMIPSSCGKSGHQTGNTWRQFCTTLEIELLGAKIRSHRNVPWLSSSCMVSCSHPRCNNQLYKSVINTAMNINAFIHTYTYTHTHSHIQNTHAWHARTFVHARTHAHTHTHTHKLSQTNTRT